MSGGVLKIRVAFKVNFRECGAPRLKVDLKRENDLEA